MTDSEEIHARLQQESGHSIFEIPTLPPSVIALRLFDRLRKHLQETGVEIIWGPPAHDAVISDNRCRSISIKSAGREQKVEARAYVFALEDAADGAWRADVDAIRDPFFHRVLARSASPIERSDPSLFRPQPFSQVGYPINSRLQPLDENGDPFADNVFVAGGAIRGYDPAGTKSRGGLSIASGYRAAREALAA